MYERMKNMKKYITFENFALAIIVMITLGIIVAGIALYQPELVRSKFLAISEKFPEYVIVLFTGVLALATSILAYTTSRTIRSNREQEEYRRKESRLKEIVDWSTQILVCGRDISAEKFTRLSTRGVTERAELIEVRQRYNILTWRGVYIRNIAEDIDQQIYRVILIAITRINQHIKVLDLSWYGKVKDNAAIGRHRKRLDDCAKLIIEIAVQLLSNRSKSSS